MAKLTKEQIDTLKNQSLVRLNCDGFDINVMRFVRDSKVRVFIDVNGNFEFVWLEKPTEHEESKFFRPWVKSYKKSSRSKKMTKYDTGMKKMSYASMGQALRYLNNVCDSVELAKGDE